MLYACGGGNSSSNNTPPPTSPPTATPTAGAVNVTTSPSPLTLSVSGNGGVARSATVAATQSGATGNLSLTIGTPPCYAATPTASDLVQLENVTQNYSSSSGAQLGFTLVAKNAGSCVVTITPASGTPVNVTVTVGS